MIPFSFIGSNMCHVEQNVPVQIIALLLRGDSYPLQNSKRSGHPAHHCAAETQGSFGWECCPELAIRKADEMADSAWYDW